MVCTLNVTSDPTGVSRFSNAVYLAPQGHWEVSGASMQVRRTVILLLSSETRTVSPSPTKTTVAALALAMKPIESSNADNDFTKIGY